MKHLKTRIKEFYSELTTIHKFYTDNGLWSGDVYELKEEYEKTFIKELSGGDN
jgi:hypothetical protein